MPHGDAGVVERGYADDAWAVSSPGGWPSAKTAASRRHRVGGGPGRCWRCKPPGACFRPPD